MMKNINVPPLGEGIDKVIVSSWYVKPGDKILLDQDIVEIAADKATFNIASEQDGILKEIFIKEGAQAKIGETLATLE